MKTGRGSQSCKEDKVKLKRRFLEEKDYHGKKRKRKVRGRRS